MENHERIEVLENENASLKEENDSLKEEKVRLRRRIRELENELNIARQPTREQERKSSVSAKIKEETPPTRTPRVETNSCGDAKSPTTSSGFFSLPSPPPSSLDTTGAHSRSNPDAAIYQKESSETSPIMDAPPFDRRLQNIKPESHMPHRGEDIVIDSDSDGDDVIIIPMKGLRKFIFVFYKICILVEWVSYFVHRP